MCGRFTLAVDPAELQENFPDVTFPAQYAPRYNIAPSQPVLAIPNDGSHKADFFVWGLIPSWAKDPTIGSRMINARGETIGEKPAFRGAYKYKRCLIPTSGFYEWKSQPGTKVKVPYFIQLKSGQPFAFAGLWDEWHSPDGALVRSCTIITTEPNSMMAQLHNRMPVILQPGNYTRWLDQTPQTPQMLQPLIAQYPAEAMTAHAVSTLVNSPANDRPELIQPGGGHF